MPPVDVLLVVAGQDRGARFGLLGTEATIGRGPVMDMVLTDPRVSRRHAILRMHGSTLEVEDLTSTGGTAVNGVDITAPTALARGDTLRLGDTELTVLWGPDTPPAAAGGASGARAPAAPAAITEESPVPGVLVAPPEPMTTRPAPARPATPAPIVTVRVAGARPPARAVSTGMLFAGVGIAAAVLALVATAMPALENASGARNFWDLDVPGLGALALICGLLGLAACGAWLAAEIRPAPARLRAVLAMAAAGCGGFIAGAPLFVSVASTPGYGTGGGLPTMALCGVVVAACGVARLVETAGGRRGVTGDPPPLDALLVASGGVGGAAVVVAAPMTWVSRNGADLGGFDATIGAGRWLVPLALTMVAACVLTALVGRFADRRAVTPTAAVALALAAVTLTFTVSAALALGDDVVQTGLMLAIAGAALGFAACAIGAASLAWGHPGDGPGVALPGAGPPPLR